MLANEPWRRRRLIGYLSRSHMNALGPLTALRCAGTLRHSVNLESMARAERELVGLVKAKPSSLDLAAAALSTSAEGTLQGQHDRGTQALSGCTTEHPSDR